MMRLLVITFLVLLPAMKGFSNTGYGHSQPKIINLTVNPDGSVIMGRDTLSAETLAAALKERLWKSYLGNGKMYDSIQVTFNGEVLMGVRGATLDAIKLAQTNALKEVCLQKYEQVFDNLPANKQEKLRKQFPVLFQEMKW
jgi:hypothetical protein